MNLIQQIWTTNSIKGVAGHTTNHKNEQYDWSGTENPILREYMEKLTEPGATKMWDGWFTVHWIPIIMDMAHRQNNNAKRANTYKLAIATAEKIRNVIKQGLYKMWKIRNEIKHEERVKHKWTKKEIEDILRQLKKSRATERHSVEEILTWRKRKIDSWAKRRQKDIEQGIKKQKEDREALHRFRTKWNLIIPNQRDQTKHKPRTPKPTNEQEKKRKPPEQSEQIKEKRTENTEGDLTAIMETNNKKVNTAQGGEGNDKQEENNETEQYHNMNSIQLKTTDNDPNMQDEAQTEMNNQSGENNQETKKKEYTQTKKTKKGNKNH